MCIGAGRQAGLNPDNGLPLSGRGLLAGASRLVQRATQDWQDSLVLVTPHGFLDLDDGPQRKHLD